MEKMMKIYENNILILINKLEEVCKDDQTLNNYFLELEEKNKISFKISFNCKYIGAILWDTIHIEDAPLFKNFIGLNIHLDTGVISVAGLNKGKLKPIHAVHYLPENIRLKLFKKATNLYFNKLKNGAF